MSQYNASWRISNPSHHFPTQLFANAGLLLNFALVENLGLEALVNSYALLPGRVGGAMPGRKVLTLVNMMLVGGTHIDHANMLPSGERRRYCPIRWWRPPHSIPSSGPSPSAMSAGLRRCRIRFLKRSGVSVADREG
ncbi:MAG: hypothetical protein M1420_04860 [Actinobacteria bacterium]|nr:hypothetical protein [Actinomycetota bacterium]